MQTILQQVLITFILIVCMVFIDFIFGVAAALRSTVRGDPDSIKNGFDMSKFLDYLKHFISPYFLIWFGLSFVSLGLTYLAERFGLIVNLVAVIPISIFIDGSAGAILIVTGDSIKRNAIKLGLNFPTRK